MRKRSQLQTSQSSCSMLPVDRNAAPSDHANHSNHNCPGKTKAGIEINWMILAGIISDARHRGR